MKYFIIVSVVLSAASCSVVNTVSQQNLKTRNVASYQSLGISDADANQMQNELDVASAKGPKTYKEMFYIYVSRLQSFKAVAEDKNISAANKKIIMLKHTNYAERNIVRQTGGSGLWHSILMSGVNDSRSEIKQGHFSEATGIATKIANLFGDS
jgi:hypothetical protein